MKRFVQSMVGLGLARMLMDLLLPEGDSRRYADLGAGLCMLLCMLRTVFSLLRGIM